MADSAERPPVFPFDIVWEEIGDGRVRFEKLEGRREEFRTLAEINVGMELGLPNIERNRLTELVSKLNLEDTPATRLVDQLELVVGWYLTPLQRRALGQDIGSARAVLARAAKDARRFYESVSAIDPRTAAALYFMLPHEPDAFMPNDPLNLIKLGRRVHDFALVSERATMDLPVSSGRPSDYVRDSSLMLAIEALQEATGERVTISRGRHVNPEPHFTNAGGLLIRDLFAELGLTHESILVQAVDRLRRTGGM